MFLIFFASTWLERTAYPSALPRRRRPLLRAFGELDLLARHFLVRDQTEQVTDAVEARAPLVVRGHDVPRRKLRIGGLEHHVARPGVVEPPAPRASLSGSASTGAADP